MNFKLKRYQAAVAAIDSQLAADANEAEQAQQAVAIAQAKLAAIQNRKAARLQERAKAEAALAAAEEAALEQLNIELAGSIVRMQATDAVGNHEKIIASLDKLRCGVRTELDSPVNQRYRVNPIIQAALNLLPPRDDIHTPVYELGGVIVGKTDWASRRKAILAAAEHHEPEAA
jgi:hypothetical protein